MLDQRFERLNPVKQCQGRASNTQHADEHGDPQITQGAMCVWCFPLTLDPKELQTPETMVYHLNVLFLILYERCIVFF